MLKNLIVAAVVASLPLSASAMSISGQIDITGNVDLTASAFNSSGNLEVSGPHFIQIKTGDFASIAGNEADAFYDLAFAAAPQTVWEAGAFSFTATSFSGFVDTVSSKAFTALGYFSAAGFDDTDGMLTFSAQPNGGATRVSFSTTATPVPVPAGILLLGTALAGFGMVGRKRA